jgi:hypothetical protein
MLNLHSFASSPRPLSDFLSYGAFRAEGIPAPRTGWAELWMNGTKIGTYTLVEQVNQSFINRHFQFTRGDLYKPEAPSGTLLWRGTNISGYPTLYPELQEGSDHSAVIHFLDVINNSPAAEFSAVLDLKLMFAYLAGNAALGNSDAYPEESHNYYLYECAPGKFGFLPWDMNLSNESIVLIPSGMSPANRFMNGLLADANYRQIYFRFLLKFLSGAASREVLNSRMDFARAVLKERITPGAMVTLQTNIQKRTEVLFTQLFRALGPSPFPRISINEILASNKKTIRDDFGEFEDYIELRNNSDQVINLRGMYLSDDAASPKKFQFLDDVSIDAGGYLLLWADGDPKQGRFHLPFKLSAAGETVLLTDVDARANFTLDEFTFQQQVPDIAEGRVSEQWALHVPMVPTPGAANRFEDRDADGMPDRWEIENGLDPNSNDGSLDLDGDGVSNLQEFFDGTSPRVPLLPPRLTINSNPRENRIILDLSWSAEETAVDLLDWSSTANGPWQALPGYRGGSSFSQPLDPGEKHRFFRVGRFMKP